jgi:hypothetical protein
MAELAASDDLAPRTRKGHKGRWVLLAMLGVIGIACVVLGFAYTTREIDPKLPDLGAVPAFSLIDQDGKPFTEEALRGHPTVINFIFTRCDTICPVIAMKTNACRTRRRIRAAPASRSSRSPSIPSSIRRRSSPSSASATRPRRTDGDSSPGRRTRSRR